MRPIASIGRRSAVAWKPYEESTTTAVEEINVGREKVSGLFLSLAGEAGPSSGRRHTTNVLDAIWLEAIWSYNERIIPLVESAWYTRWSLKQSALTARPAFGVPPWPAAANFSVPPA